MGKRPRLTQEFLKEPYARILIPSEGGTYFAELLEFPGCYAEGNTPQDALDNLNEAAIAWIEAATDQGQDIPKPLATYGYSGKISLRIPKSVHKKAARFAQKDDVSLNQFLASAIAARVGAEELYDRLAERLEGRLTATAYTIQIQQVMGMGLPFATFAAPSQFPDVYAGSVRPVVTMDEKKAIADG